MLEVSWVNKILKLKLQETGQIFLQCNYGIQTLSRDTRTHGAIVERTEIFLYRVLSAFPCLQFTVIKLCQLIPPRSLFIDVLQYHAIKNKNRNCSRNGFKKLGYERLLIYRQPRQDLDLCDYSFARYSEKRFTQIYRALY